MKLFWRKEKEREIRETEENILFVYVHDVEKKWIFSNDYNFYHLIHPQGPSW